MEREEIKKREEAEVMRNGEGGREREKDRDRARER